MDVFSKPIWVLVPIFVLTVIGLTCSGESDRERFDRLEIGMSVEEVYSVLRTPSTRFRVRRTPNRRETQNIEFNRHMKLRIRNGRLVNKYWKD